MELAVNQIKDLIEKTNPHGRKVIPDNNKQKDLLEKLREVRS